MGYIFRSKMAVARFLKCMEVMDGDGEAAMKKFKASSTRNGSAAVSKVSIPVLTVSPPSNRTQEAPD